MLYGLEIRELDRYNETRSEVLLHRNTIRTSELRGKRVTPRYTYTGDRPAANGLVIRSHPMVNATNPERTADYLHQSTCRDFKVHDTHSNAPKLTAKRIHLQLHTARCKTKIKVQKQRAGQNISANNNIPNRWYSSSSKSILPEMGRKLQG
jgi:hypothetical protein